MYSLVKKRRRANKRRIQQDSRAKPRVLKFLRKSVTKKMRRYSLRDVSTEVESNRIKRDGKSVKASFLPYSGANPFYHFVPKVTFPTFLQSTAIYRAPFKTFHV